MLIHASALAIAMLFSSTPTIGDFREAAVAGRVDLRSYREGGGCTLSARYSVESMAVLIRKCIRADSIACLSDWAQKQGLIMLTSEL